MPRNRECDYCGTDIEPGTGTMFVRTTGSTIHYCSSKCEKNANLGREARDLEWAGEEEADEGTTEETETVTEADEPRPTDIEDQGQRVDAPGDADEDLEDVDPDAVDAGASDPEDVEADADDEAGSDSETEADDAEEGDEEEETEAEA